MKFSSFFVLQSATLALLTGALVAAPTTDPLQGFADRLGASLLATNQFMDVATERVLAAADPLTAQTAEVDAARQALSARFQEPWSYETSVWWTWRIAGSQSAFAPVVHSVFNASRSLDDLHLLAHPYDASYLDTMPEGVRSYLELVPPQQISAFVFSARIDGDLETVGFAASYSYLGAEMLFFSPVATIAPASQVTALESAASLWLSTMESLVGDIGLYPAFVDLLVGAPDTSMDGPLDGGLTSAVAPCHSGDVLQCLNDAWNAFLARKAQLTAALKLNLQNELRQHNRNLSDQRAIYLSAMRQAGSVVSGLLHIFGIPGMIGPNAGLLEEISRGHDIRMAQLRDAHKARVQALRAQYCADLNGIVNDTFAQVQGCMADVCPNAAPILQAALETMRAQMIAMGASCQ